MKLALMPRRERKTGSAGCLGSRVSYDEQKATLNLLGMTLTEVVLDEERSGKLGSRTGVVVLVVDATRDAYLGGVRNGDVVAEVNSVKITRLQDLKRVLQEQDPHDPIFMFLLAETGWRFVNLSFISSLP
ncbi:MAG: PDZ domain-containing protein [Geobacter sp.]|nr:MAG: PDZ domain-containing protein [Geobacter sp.]